MQVFFHKYVLLLFIFIPEITAKGSSKQRVHNVKNEDLLNDVKQLPTNPNSSNMISNRTSKDVMMTVK